MNLNFQRKNAFSLLALVFLAGQTACATPSLSPIPFPGGTVSQAAPATQVQMTRVIALSTAPAASPTKNKAGSDSTGPTAPGAATLTPQATAPAQPQSTRPESEGNLPCDKAAPGSPIDVTIADNTQVFPGQGFTKTWRLVNNGRCRWTREYSAEWFSGVRLGDTQVVYLGDVVPSGESLDLTVDMVAPETPGTYQSNWKLRNAQKEWFGIGPDGDQVFWVRIVVVEVDTETPKPTATAVPPSPTPTPTFEPTLTPTLVISPTATPVVLFTGEASLLINDRLDLDSGQVNVEGEDLTFEMDVNQNHWLVPQGGGFLGVFGGSLPTLQRCLSANMSAAPIPVESLSPGTYLCYRTGQSAPGWLQYDSFQEESAALKVLFLTWAAP
jgi:hypothetical protein